MTLLGRLAFSVPPARFHLVRDHGVLASARVGTIPSFPVVPARPPTAIRHFQSRAGRALGDRFCARVLPETAADLKDLPPFVEAHVKCPHSVVTVNPVDEADTPTTAARDEILAFFANRLAPRDDDRRIAS